MYVNLTYAARRVQLSLSCLLVWAQMGGHSRMWTSSPMRTSIRFTTLNIFVNCTSRRMPTILVGTYAAFELGSLFDLPNKCCLNSRFTVPVLWDKKNHTIVNNESSEIIRIFNTAFNEIISEDRAVVDIYPKAHRAEIDSINEWVYDTVNSAYSLPSRPSCE